MPRRLLTTVAIAIALSATAAPAASARPIDDPAVQRPSAPTTTRVTVTRPDGFAWLEALLGAAAGGALVALAVTSAGLRRRPGPAARAAGVLGR